ncbi:hypothetical protein DFH08DRAFT_941575 [Mycena albidolilacea]|uniref:Integrase n=1 Tax=Mycena albidolilacea TaxID=1033008 RepID=A0AAD6ZIU9_9AGAR|nr:hypothetical protein DFH08DRAFT_941575 [Mycena albidolilacea]
MPKAATAPKMRSGGKKAGGEKAATGTADVLKQKKTALQEEFGKAQNTRDAYKGYLARGIAIVKDVVAERMRLEKEDPGALPDRDIIDVKLLATALQGPPNKHSVYVLSLYLTQKCVEEGFGKSTADGIHGAFANYWDNLPDSGGKYTGQYSFDEETGKVLGNPARAAEIQSFMKCIKNKAPMMQWSGSECPNEKLENAPKTQEELELMIKHGQTRAFLSSGYTLWTRNFETCQIQMHDIGDRTGPSPYYLPFLHVFLDNRKGWQQKQGYDGPLKSNSYEIYEQKETPEIDMYNHVHRWLRLYRRLLKRDLEGTDYLFPYVSSNGMIHPKRPMTHDTAQDLINEFAAAALINKFFTTHCLRRGGSQYRFMFAPLGKRWSLTIIRWWGGWAEGEHVDTLMRYLLDSLQSYESGHGDALYPFRTEPDKSFMGEHNLLQVATKAELNSLGHTILTRLDGMTALNASPAVSLPSMDTISAVLSALGTSASSLSSGGRQTTIADLGKFVMNHNSERLPAVATCDGSHDGQMTAMSESGSGRGSAATDWSDSNIIPVANTIIPKLRKSNMAWKQAIEQWDNGDPANGLTTALKDWPAEWHTGETMRLKNGTLYSNRKLIAEEYKSVGLDDDTFKQRYPEHTNVTKLLAAIRKRNGLVRRLSD